MPAISKHARSALLLVAPLSVFVLALTGAAAPATADSVSLSDAVRLFTPANAPVLSAASEQGPITPLWAADKNVADTPGKFISGTDPAIDYVAGVDLAPSRLSELAAYIASGKTIDNSAATAPFSERLRRHTILMPEPTTLLLVGTCLLLFGSLSRRDWTSKRTKEIWNRYDLYR